MLAEKYFPQGSGRYGRLASIVEKMDGFAALKPERWFGIWAMVLAGIAIFTTVFALDANPAEGPGLIFVVLPSVFPQLAGGTLWGTLFFFLLFMAALTSAISILEVVTAYFIDQQGWSRKKATLLFGGIITVVGVFCSLSLGGGINITGFLGMSFFDFMDYLSSKYMLPIGGMLTAIFVLKKWGVNRFMEELKQGMDKIALSKEMITVIFGIAATVVGFIILNEVIDVIFGIKLIQ